jgi:hypothetical protein
VTPENNSICQYKDSRKTQKSQKSPTNYAADPFLLNAIAQVHFGAERRDLPGWAKNARAQFLDSFNSLAKKSEFYRYGYKQAMWDMMVEELAKESEWWAAQRKEAAKLCKIDGESIEAALLRRQLGGGE